VIPALLLASLHVAHAGDVARTWLGWAELPPAAREVSNPECRVALVIGNSRYQHINNVDNAVNDARAIAALLDDLMDFDVVRAFNVDEDGFKQAVADYASRIEPGCASTVYYAGHAAEGSSGDNYMLPVDAVADDPTYLRLHAISLQDVQAALLEHGAGARLYFFDACRTRTFDGARGSATTTARITNPPVGAFTAFASSAGQPAADGVGSDHSPFAAALLKWAPVPGQKVEQVFDKVQNEFADAADGQKPAGSDELIGDFYFLPPIAGHGDGGGDGGGVGPIDEPPPWIWLSPLAAVDVRPGADHDATGIAPMTGGGGGALWLQGGPTFPQWLGLRATAGLKVVDGGGYWVTVGPTFGLGVSDPLAPIHIGAELAYRQEGSTAASGPTLRSWGLGVPLLLALPLSHDERMGLVADMVPGVSRDQGAMLEAGWHLNLHGELGLLVGF